MGNKITEIKGLEKLINLKMLGIDDNGSFNSNSNDVLERMKKRR
ncbi:hypothetical protein LCGC14_0682030 [marine sediment metagenome]|uniref:Uncharacterized protein n=1 Tax=marine sediment metagenome TaxID=412755 RepID=A0A0F9QMY6_9ZZZZ